MAAGNTYIPLATQTLGSATSSVTFSSISGAYTDLVLVIDGRVTVDASAIIGRFNGDSGSNYNITELYGNGTSATGYRWASQSFFAASTYAMGLSSASPSTVVINIMNYANTTTHKTVLTRSSDGGKGVSAVISRWSSTAAITSIVVSVSNFDTGTTFNLYGIAAA